MLTFTRYGLFGLFVMTAVLCVFGAVIFVTHAAAPVLVPRLLTPVGELYLVTPFGAAALAAALGYLEILERRTGGGRD